MHWYMVKLTKVCFLIFYVHIFQQKMMPWNFFPIENKMEKNIAVQKGGKS